MLSNTLRRSLIRGRPSTSTLAFTTRSFQTSTSRSFPGKNDQDKDSIDTTSREYSKSGGDAAAANATDKAAFDPQQTRPETEHETARQETGSVSREAWQGGADWLIDGTGLQQPAERQSCESGYQSAAGAAGRWSAGFGWGDRAGWWEGEDEWRRESGEERGQ